MLASIATASLNGANAYPVRVEVFASRGIPRFSIVGLADAPCRESRDRIRGAIVSSGLQWPRCSIMINVAPTTVSAAGSAFDLAIALGLLAITEQIPRRSIGTVAALAELGLDGRLRPIDGVVALAAAIPDDTLIVSEDQGRDAVAVGNRRVLVSGRLGEIVDALNGKGPVLAEAHAERGAIELASQARLPNGWDRSGIDQALEVTAAGNHHLLLGGPPDTDLSMLAHHVAALMPDLDDAQAQLVTRIHSVAGGMSHRQGLIRRPPFRAPHHGISAAGLIGGGGNAIRPGEISLASEGVLFLDEMDEFKVAVLDALCQPLDAGVIAIARLGAAAILPARVVLIGTVRSCPCGETTAGEICRCTGQAWPRDIRQRCSSLLDRFDLQIVVDRSDLMATPRATAQHHIVTVNARVTTARAIARTRGVRANADLVSAELEQFAPLTASARTLSDRLWHHGQLSLRALRRIRLVARTVMDLDGDEGPIDEAALATAAALRGTALSAQPRP